MPRIGVPRAKGGRSARQGRWIYLGPHGARLIREMDRPVGSEHLAVPGQRHGSPLHTLIPLWREVLETAGLPRMAVKALLRSARERWSEQRPARLCALGPDGCLDREGFAREVGPRTRLVTVED